MKNKSTIIISIVVLLLLSLLIYLVTRPEEKFNIIELSNKNFVSNRGSRTYLDTIVQVGLDKLGIEGETVMVKEQPVQRDLGDEFESEAYIIYQKGQSIIFMTPNINRLKAIEIISHELIHLEQYRTDRLQILKGGYVCWENDTIDVTTTPYNKRPWEDEAFNYGPLLEEDIKLELYERE
jgi:hypothetical protein